MHAHASAQLYPRRQRIRLTHRTKGKARQREDKGGLGKGNARTDGTRIFVERILGSIRADTFNTTIEICLPMTMRTVQPKSGSRHRLRIAAVELCDGEEARGRARLRLGPRLKTLATGLVWVEGGGMKQR